MRSAGRPVTPGDGVLRLVYTRGREVVDRRRRSRPSARWPTAWRAHGDGIRRRRDVDRGLLCRRGRVAVAAGRGQDAVLCGEHGRAATRRPARRGDVVFVSSDGFVLEGPRSTVVIVVEGDDGEPVADPAAVVPDPAGHHPAGVNRSRRLRLRLSRPSARRSFCRNKRLIDSSITLAARVHTLTAGGCPTPRWPPRSLAWSTPRLGAIAERNRLSVPGHASTVVVHREGGVSDKLIDLWTCEVAALASSARVNCLRALANSSESHLGPRALGRPTKEPCSGPLHVCGLLAVWVPVTRTLSAQSPRRFIDSGWCGRSRAIERRRALRRSAGRRRTWWRPGRVLAEPAG